MRSRIFERASFIAAGALVGALVTLGSVAAQDSQPELRLDRTAFLAADASTRANVLHAMGQERRAVASALISIGGDASRDDGERSWALLGLRTLTLDQQALGFCVQNAGLKLEASPQIGGLAPVREMERPCLTTLKVYAAAGTPEILARITPLRDADALGAVAQALVHAWGEPTAKAIVAAKLAEAPSERHRAGLKRILDAMDSE